MLQQSIPTVIRFFLYVKINYVRNKHEKIMPLLKLNRVLMLELLSFFTVSFTAQAAEQGRLTPPQGTAGLLQCSLAPGMHMPMLVNGQATDRAMLENTERCWRTT